MDQEDSSLRVKFSNHHKNVELNEVCRQTIAQIKEAGTYKVERVITSS